MMRYSEGSACGLTYTTDFVVTAGIYIVTTGGTGFRVTEARLMKSKTRKYALKVLRCHPKNIPDGATILPLYWNSRNKKKNHAKPRY